MIPLRSLVAALLADVRREAVGVIGYLKVEAALPALIATAADADPSVHRATTVALVFLRPGGPGIAILIAGLTDENWQVREEAAVSAGKIRLPGAVEVLIARMDDPVWQVRIKVANALGRVKAANSVPVLGRALGSDVGNLRKEEAAAALGEIADPRPLPALEVDYDDPGPDVRKRVRWAIGRCRAA